MWADGCGGSGAAESGVHAGSAAGLSAQRGPGNAAAGAAQASGSRVSQGTHAAGWNPPPAPFPSGPAVLQLSSKNKARTAKTKSSLPKRPGFRSIAKQQAVLSHNLREDVDFEFDEDDPEIAVSRFCSNRSSVLFRCPTPRRRARGPYGFCLRPPACRDDSLQASPRSPGSRAWNFQTCMGSATTQGRPATRVGATGRVAFRSGDGVGAPPHFLPATASSRGGATECG